MNWLVSILQGLFDWAFKGLEILRNAPWIVFTIVICLGLLYWLIYQQKYNRQADADSNQIK